MPPERIAPDPRMPRVRMSLEEGISVTADGVRYLADRQTELILIPSA